RSAGPRANRVNDAVFRNHGGAEVALLDAVALPIFLAGVGIEGAHGIGNAEHDFLLAARHIDERWRAPPALDAGGLPLGLAGLLVQGNERAAFDAGVDDDEILVQKRAGSRAPHVQLVADVGIPNFLPREIESEHAGLAVENKDLFTVGCRGAGG